MGRYPQSAPGKPSVVDIDRYVLKTKTEKKQSDLCVDIDYVREYLSWLEPSHAPLVGLVARLANQCHCFYYSPWSITLIIRPDEKDSF